MNTYRKVIKCRLCGAEIEARSANRKYCDTCSRAAKRMAARKRYKKYIVPNVPRTLRPKAPAPNVSQCRKCVYRGYIGKTIFCDYIEITGTMRGCDPSPDCVVFEKYTKARRSELTDPKRLTQKICAPNEIDEQAAYVSERIRAEREHKHAHRRR